MKQIKITKQVTNRNESSLDKYMHDISRIELISADQEVELAKKIRNGDTEALLTLVRANLRFVISVAKQYQNQGLSLSDLINEGNLGLIKAAQRFDETRGFKFISYAVWWIRQSIIQSISEKARIVRLPSNKIGTINRVNKTISHLEQKLEREPTSDELAEEMNINELIVKTMYDGNSRHMSLDAPIIQDEDSNMYDILPNTANSSPDKWLTMESLQKEIEVSLASLSIREQNILKMYYGLCGFMPHTLLEIGHICGLTQERVRQLKDKAIKRLKTNKTIAQLKPYL